jgi:hypothetical protein
MDWIKRESALDVKIKGFDWKEEDKKDAWVSSMAAKGLNVFDVDAHNDSYYMYAAAMSLKDFRDKFPEIDPDMMEMIGPEGVDNISIEATGWGVI